MKRLGAMSAAMIDALSADRGSEMLAAERYVGGRKIVALPTTRTAFDTTFHEHDCPGCEETFEHSNDSRLSCGIGDCPSCFHYRLFPVEKLGGTQ